MKENEMDAWEIQLQIKAWKKEQKNKKSKYSDYFIQRQINEYERKLGDAKLQKGTRVGK